MIINRNKHTEQIQFERGNDVLPLYRLENRKNCYVLADTFKDTVNDLDSITKGTFNTYRVANKQATGKTSFTLYIEDNVTKRELLDFLYRNLDVFRIRRTSLETGESVYSICSVSSETIERIMQSETHEGEIEVTRHTEWLQEIELIEEDNESDVNGDTYPLMYPFKYSSFVKKNTTQFFGTQSAGHLPPYFIIYMYNGYDPKITLTDGYNNTQVIQFNNTTLVGSDTLILDNRKGLISEFGMKQTLNGVDYFGNTRFNSNTITLPTQATSLMQEYRNTDTSTNYVTFFNLETRNFEIKVENCMSRIIPVHRFVRWN